MRMKSKKMKYNQSKQTHKRKKQDKYHQGGGWGMFSRTPATTPIPTTTLSGKYCAPKHTTKQGGQSSMSCYEHTALINIATELNKELMKRSSHPSQQQAGNPPSSSTSSTQSTSSSLPASANHKLIDLHQPFDRLWHEIDQKMKPICKTERCWKRHLKMDDTKEFRPPMPTAWKKDMNSWLNNYNILHVLKQYEASHSDFVFYGPVPVDFYADRKHGTCLQKELCQLKLKELIKQHKYKIGIVFNLDYHDQSGSHWVAMFINILSGDIYYYDSYAYPYPKEIKHFADKVAEQGKQIKAQHSKLHVPFHLHFNPIRHQFGNSECGVYCIYFIIQMLEGIPFDTFIHNGLNDKQINQYRLIFFDPQPF